MKNTDKFKYLLNLIEIPECFALFVLYDRYDNNNML